MAKQTATPARPARTTTASRPATTRQTPTRSTSARRSAASTRAKAKENIPARPFQMPFDKKNMAIIFAGIAVIVVGYLVMYLSPVMSTMALTVSPIILLIGYLVIVPIGIMSGVHSNRKNRMAASEPFNGVAAGPPSSNGTAPNAV